MIAVYILGAAALTIIGRLYVYVVRPVLAAIKERR